MLNITLIGKSDTGLIRSNNEDAFLVSPELNFVALADGMGGAAAGEVASAYFVRAAWEVFSQNSNQNAPASLKRAFELANCYILDYANEHPAHRGLGCTAELLAFVPGGFALGHVGDSRTYLLRGGEFKPLTQDHSFVQELINKGVISVEEARVHRMRHVILRAVGQSDKLEVELIHGDTLPGDVFMLCSDGLTDMVEDARIHEILSRKHSLDQLAQDLIDAAKDSGGHDNVTVVLCRIEEDPDDTASLLKTAVQTHF
ncbi:MAG: Stp1/IreP family PP2C-type Ser/Thr phosphatase [Desulfobacteraceae bacterium]|nr:Stp1/IreP family PP2C-type Ser/Thr phosphatase [Desulfobacteraceae bacterium]